MSKNMLSKNFVRGTTLAVLFNAFSLLLIIGPGAYGQGIPAKRVLVISLDGLDTRYINDPDKYQLRIPTLRRLMANGVTARGMSSVYPSITYPNHTSLVTGALPSKHGIFGNSIFEAPTGIGTGTSHWLARDIKAETLWDAAKRTGKKVGMVSWPVGGGVGDWNVPEIWQPGGTPEQTRVLIAKTARPEGLVETISAQHPDIYRNSTADEGDDARTRFAEYVIAEKRPEVMLVHLYDLDHFQHDFGPFTPEAISMLEKTDGYVARLLAAAERAGTLDETAVFITSDHGFKPITRQLHPGVLLQKAGLVGVRTDKDENGRDSNIITDWKAAVYVTGAACAIYLKNPDDKKTLKKLRDIFEPLARQPGSGIFKVLDKKDLRKIGSNSSAVLMLDAADGFTFGANYFGDFNVESRSRGMHGYLPTRPEYFASFIASGTGVERRGTIEYLNMTDAGATIARSLGLKLRDASGKPVNLIGVRSNLPMNPAQ